MRPLTRCGFTLIELLLGLVLLALFATLVVTVVRGAGRVATRSMAALAADRTLLVLQTFLQQELRDGVSSDITLRAPARMAMLRPIGEATPCADSAGALLIADSAWHGVRVPQRVRDDVFLLMDPVAETWLRLALDSVGTGRCPGSNAVATRLSVTPHTGTGVVARVLEPVEFLAYRSGAADWFGLRPARYVASVQPFAGPLVPGTTLFSWYADHIDVAFKVPGTAATNVRTPLTPP